MPPDPVCTIAEAEARLTAPGSPFETEQATVQGRRMLVWKHAPPTLRAVVEGARSYGDRTYLVYEGERHGYHETFERVTALAAELVRAGVQKGDRVAVALRNYPEWPVAFWATVAIGAVVVPLNAWWKRAELEFALEDCGARVLFADGERIALLETWIAETQSLAIAVRTALAPAGTRPFHEVVRVSASLPDVSLEPDDDATLFYTSGTTGKPKGALGTHRNVCTNILSAGYGAARAALRRGEPIPEPAPEQRASLVSVPFFHVTGCHSGLVVATATGGKMVLMRKWQPERALELIERKRINSFGGVPAMAWQVLDSPQLAATDTRSVERVAYGGAPAAPELVRRLKLAFPRAQPGNGYGLTESSAIACTNTAEDYLRKPDSVGPPVAICQVKVIAPNGEPVAPGVAGELCLYGPNIVKEYRGRARETAETFRDGWLHTGDIAKQDEEGFVYILDRAKDMLIRGGENIYCVEVEAVLYAHPDVMDAALIGLPHPVLGEEPAAVVQVAPRSGATEAALREYVRERLAGFKVPVRIEMRLEPLPRNANGKIVKRLLREQLLQSQAGHPEGS